MELDRIYIVTGFVWLIAGMVFGIYLGSTDQLNFANSHAHMNLLGFVISVLFGLIYKSWPMLLRRLAVVQYITYQTGAVVLVAGKFDIDNGGGELLSRPMPRSFPLTTRPFRMPTASTSA